MAIIYDRFFRLLEERKVSSYRLRHDKVLPETTLTAMRKNQSVTIKTIDSLCAYLNVQPEQLMEYVQDDNPQKEQKKKH